MCKLKLVIGTVLLSFGTAPVFAQCNYPDAVSLPDGRTATEAEMRAAKLAAEAYIATMEAYLNCLEAEAADPAAADGAARADARRSALNAMKRLADDYNKQLLAFKTANN